MKTVEDQYIDMVARDELLVELSAGTGVSLGDDDDLGEIRRDHVPSDAEIEREVRAALAHDLVVPVTRVAPRVHDGWVTLEGRVEHHYEKEEAEEVVLALDDVRGIVDHLVVSAER